MKNTPHNKAIVTIIMESSLSERDFVHISDDRYSMIYRANVRTAAGEEEHLIIQSFPHSISQAERESVNHNLRKTNAKANISFIVADREGWTQVIAGLDKEFDAFNLAAANSVIKASCGWDESRPIVVMINGVDVQVWPRVEGEHWVAEAWEDTNCEGSSERTFLC